MLTAYKNQQGTQLKDAPLVFKNEPELDFTDTFIKSQMEDAFANFENGQEYPLIIGDQRKMTTEKIISVNPGNKEEVLGYVASASVEDARSAMEAATSTFETWKYTPADERIQLAQNLIELMQEHRYELNALIIEESGKNWGEADGEVCETIDFINAYCIGVQQLDKGLKLQHLPHETTSAFYIPIGVGAIIPPWNFPLALMAGMVVGAIITGNTCVVKPASDTPLVAYRFLELVLEAGFPAGTVNFLPGSGREIGNFLVEHEDTRFINFTGSKAVGLNINKQAAITSETGRWIKRIVAEMGGKNAIIVDKTANIKKAAEGVAQSAFSFQGQKCSACSRVLVDETVHDEFLEELVAYTKTFEMGLGRDNAMVGPVVSQRAFDSITEYIEIGKKEGTLVYGGTYDDSKGFYIQPTIIADITHGDRISVEEIFGPVLAVIKTTSFDQALEIANDTEYGLTGAVYTQNEDQVEQASREFFVGNLYFNRKSTGAVVQQHPFGGYNMSGTAAKTGTTDYLYNFVQMKSVARDLGE